MKRALGDQVGQVGHCGPWKGELYDSGIVHLVNNDQILDEGYGCLH